MFSFGSQNLVAIDIGTSSIKIAEVRFDRKGIELKKFGMQSLPNGLVDLGEIKDPVALANIIEGLLKEIKVTSKKAVTGLWGSSVLVKKINMPKMDIKLLAEQIRWEAEQYIPFDINEVALDHHVINKKSGDNLEVLLVAAKQENLFRVLETFESAKLKSSIVDISTFALANCFEVNYGRPPGFSVVMNIGAGVINFVVIEDGEIVHARDLAIGGQTFTTEISKNMGLSIPEAEALKISASRRQEVPKEVLDMVSSVNDQLVDEIKTAFEFLVTSIGLTASSTKIYITGGSSPLPDLSEKIGRMIGVKPEVLDPFLAVKYDQKVFRSDYIDKIRPLCSVVIGLGLRQAVERT
jgi:type IV pilus assembly protein PilM